MKRLVLLGAAALGACAPPAASVPGPLRAAVATVPLDVPVGIATGGYGRSRRPADPISPWADTHVPTIGVQTQPSARALALSNGATTVVLVRLDACVTVATLRWRAQELLEATGLHADLVLSATHTHSGPARYFHPVPASGSGGIDPARIAMDSYDPESEFRLATGIATAAAQALGALRPAAVGVATVDAADLNSDRRCENDDLYGAGFRDTTLTVVRLDEVDASGARVRPLTGLVHFALHGTMLDDDNHLLSVDAPGAIELFASDEVGAPLVFLQGAAGDVSPSTGKLGHGEFQGMERIGRVAARKVKEAWARAAPRPASARATLARYELPVEPGRAAIGYAEGEFPENGAVGCGLGESHCPPVEAAPRSIPCLPLVRRPFRETTVVAIRLENVLIGTLPGEPTAAIGERVKAAGARVEGVTNVLTAGYAQDHFGYLLEEKDYLRLGYEPSVSPLGWKFGDFIAGRLEVAFDRLGTESPRLRRPRTEGFTARAATPSELEPRQVGSTADVRRLEAAAFVFEGGDPSLGTPRVALEREAGGAFEPVRASPVRLVEGGPDIVLFHEPVPSVASAPAAHRRAHRWRAIWETVQDTPAGRYRLIARGRTLLEGGESSYRVESNAFAVSATEAFGMTGEARVGGNGELRVVVRFPPNPSVRDAAGTVVGNFRLRDEGTRDTDGARAQGGTLAGTLVGTDGTARGVNLPWDAARGAYWAPEVSRRPGDRLTVAPGGLVDGFGNTNRARLVFPVE